jgi:hypothetical protein
MAAGPLATRAAAQANAKGVWSEPYDIGNVPVHFIVAPSSEDTLHSQVFWWRDRFGHGLLKWGIPTAASDTVSRLFPIGLGGNYSTGTLPDPTYNHFCGSHTRLADGRIFVAGGTEVNAFEVGIRHNSILDPATREYVAGDTLDMAQRRWYPTATTLRDGKILIHSGSEYFHVHLFGGRDTASVRPDSLVRLAVTDSGMWDGDVTNPTGDRPLTRDLHSMVPNNVYSATEYFGGRDSSGAALDKLYFAHRDGGVNDADYTYTWTPMTTLVDPSGPPDAPAARYLAAATHLNGGELVVFGGTGSGAVFGDLWVLQRTGGPPPTPYAYTWHLATQSGATPSARCGATLMRQEGLRADTLLLFGGANGADALPTDSTVYALTLSLAGGHYTGTWSAVSVTSSPTSNPGPRTQAAMLMDEAQRYRTTAGDDQHRALLFGGRTETGALANDLWAFWMVDNGGSPFGEWQRIPTSGGPRHDGDTRWPWRAIWIA